jgi:hypothetical protein
MSGKDSQLKDTSGLPVIGQERHGDQEQAARPRSISVVERYRKSVSNI